MDCQDIPRNQPLTRKTTIPQPASYTGFSDVKLLDVRHLNKAKLSPGLNSSSSSSLRDTNRTKVKFTKLMFTDENKDKIESVDSANKKIHKKDVQDSNHSLPVGPFTLRESESVNNGSKKFTEISNIHHDLDKIFEDTLKNTELHASTKSLDSSDINIQCNSHDMSIGSLSNRKRTSESKHIDSAKKKSVSAKENEGTSEIKGRPETSEQTLKYINRQRKIWKQKMKNEKNIAKDMKDKRKQSLHELQLKSRQLLKCNLEKKCVKGKKSSIMGSIVSEEKHYNSVNSSVKDCTTTLNMVSSHENEMDIPGISQNDNTSVEKKVNVAENFQSNLNENEFKKSSKVNLSLAERCAIQIQAAYRGYHTRKLLKPAFKAKQKETLLITTDKTTSQKRSAPVQKVMKSELRITSDLYSTHMSVDYPYNFITAVKNKLSMTLNSTEKKKSEKYTVANPEFSKSAISSQLKKIKNVSNETLMNMYNQPIDSYCIMPSLQHISKSPLNSTLSFPKKISLKQISKHDNNLSSEMPVNKNIDNKNSICNLPSGNSINKPQKLSTLSELKSSLAEIQNLTVSFSYNDVVEDESGDKECEKLNDLNNCYTKLEFCDNTKVDNNSPLSKNNIIDNKLSNVDMNNANSLKAPDLNLVWCKQNEDGRISEDNSNAETHNVPNQFENELHLLDSFNESLRNVQLVEETLSSIRKSVIESPKKNMTQANSVDESLRKVNKHILQGGKRVNTGYQITNSDYQKKGEDNIFSKTGISGSDFIIKTGRINANSVCESKTQNKKMLKSNHYYENSSTDTVFSDFNIIKDDLNNVEENHVTFTNKMFDSSIVTTSTVVPKCEPDKTLKYLTCNNDASNVCYTQSGISSQQVYKNTITNIIEQVSIEKSLSRESIVRNDIESVFDASSNMSIDSKNSMSKISKNTHPNLAAHLNRFCVCLITQYIDDENVRSEYLDMFLKVREKSLLDATRSELLCLEIQKKQYQEQIPFLKKKQRGLLLKLQQERNEIKLMKKFQQEQSLERRETLKRQLKQFKTLFTSDTRCKEFKNKSTSLRKSSFMLDAKKSTQKSPLKGFDFSFNSDTSEGNQAFYQLKESLLKKKGDLMKQKKQLDDLLHLHYDLQLDAAELKAIENRIKNPTRIVADFANVCFSNSSKKKNNNGAIDPIKNELLLPESAKEDQDIIKCNEPNDERDGKLDLKNHTEIIINDVEAKCNTISVVNKITKTIESIDIPAIDKLKNIHDLFDRKKSEIDKKHSEVYIDSKSTMDTVETCLLNEETTESKSKDLGFKNHETEDVKCGIAEKIIKICGQNLNNLWGKITGEISLKYENQNDYFMSQEDLETFFDDAKHIALQKLLQSFNNVKSGSGTHAIQTQTEAETKPQAEITVKPCIYDRPNIVLMIKPEKIESFQTTPSNSLMPTNDKLSLTQPSSSIEPFHKVVETLNLSMNHPSVNNQTSAASSSAVSVIKRLDSPETLSSFDKTQTNLDSSETINTNENSDYSDNSDSSKSTAHSLVEELKSFTILEEGSNEINNLVSANSSKLWPQDIENNISLKSTNDVVAEKFTLQNVVIDHEKHDNICHNRLPYTIGISDTPEKHIQFSDPSVLLNMKSCNQITSVQGIEDKSFDSPIIIKTRKSEQACDTNESDNTAIVSVQVEELCSDNSVESTCGMKTVLNSEISLILHPSSNNEIKDVSENLNTLMEGQTSGIHDLLLGTWDLMSPSPDHSPRDSPTGEYSPATAIITGTLVRNDEAEELRKKQLAIELEIKALEQQSQISYCLVREIPDKPPPPYIPPTEEVKPATIPSLAVKDNQSHIKMPTQVSAIIQMSCDWLWLQSECIENKSSDNLKSNIVDLDLPNSLSLFLFDLCNEIFQKEFNVRSGRTSPSWVYQKKSTFLPLNKTEVFASVENKVKEYLGLKLWPVKENLIVNWAYRRQDTLNTILLKELYKEEVDWANYEEYEMQVKNELTESILDSLVSEACQEYMKEFI